MGPVLLREHVQYRACLWTTVTHKYSEGDIFKSWEKRCENPEENLCVRNFHCILEGGGIWENSGTDEQLGTEDLG